MKFSVTASLTSLAASVAFAVLTFVTSFASFGSPQQQKYPWQHGDTHCNETMTFCWYGPEEFSNGQVTAHGQRWIAQDNAEKPFEWITEVRCLKEFNVCILARNQKVFSKSVTNIDLYRVQEWSQFQIRAIGESDFPHGKECEIDTLLLNRAEPSVSMLSVPGPVASTKACTGVMNPKTVIYKLEVGPPKV